MLIVCTQCRRQYDVSGIGAGESVRCRCSELIKVPVVQPREAKILRCSACGALLEGSASCAWCGGAVAARDLGTGHVCPQCFAQLPAGARFCCECGLEIKPETMRLLPAAAQCPRCKEALVRREIGDAALIECHRCAGLWLDEPAFEKAVKAGDQASLAPWLGKEPPKQRPTDPVRYLRCPVCRQFMHRKNFGGNSGVIIDWCKGHGYWFDAAELEKVMAFVKAGGLDRAREQQIADAERARDSAAVWQNVAYVQGPEPSMDLLSGIWRLLRRLLR
jgi:Zn-finger nucleic acid-binding protein